ncbi:MAG TPA: IMP cyclohydrolase [Candidatus Limiplasma sp.]|nr:IMP cyclohydrolase [Candidatus Limiplasma sp.]HRX07738.1 IMP cyclohydrolase [Candidatus Limiplasma sp.]
MKSIVEFLSGNPYPGRGILLGKTADGRALMAYFIMGRSENSRNRVFTQKDGGIITEAFDPSKLTDPSLIIYAPVRVFDWETTIVTNGDQTDTVFDALVQKKTFEDALRTRTFEPDPPNFTPRISGLLKVNDGGMRYQLSILKAGKNESPLRFFYDYAKPQRGEGHFISTYVTDGKPLPSFTGEPVAVALGDEPIDSFTETLWNALDADNRVSLFVRTIDWITDAVQTRIVNKHGN